MPCRSTRASIGRRPLASLSRVCWSNGCGPGLALRSGPLRRRFAEAVPASSANSVSSVAEASRVAARRRSSGGLPFSGCAVRATLVQMIRSSSLSLPPAPGHRDRPSSQRARHQRVEIGRAAHHAGDLAGRIARAGEEIAARRPDDRRAGVLGDHQPPERLAVERRQRRRVDVERRAEGVQQPVDGERAARRQRHLRGGDRPERRIVDRRLAEEDEGAVLPAGFRRCGRDCRGASARIDCMVTSASGISPSSTRMLPGAGEAMAGLGRIGDAAQRAVGHPQPRRALHMDEEGIDLVARARRSPARCRPARPARSPGGRNIRRCRPRCGGRRRDTGPSPAGRFSSSTSTRSAGRDRSGTVNLRGADRRASTSGS